MNLDLSGAGRWPSSSARAFLVAGGDRLGHRGHHGCPRTTSGLQLLENSLITGAALVALILALQPVSAAFNPVVTLAEVVFGARARAAAVMIVAQVVGGVVGASWRT